MNENMAICWVFWSKGTLVYYFEKPRIDWNGIPWVEKS